MDSTWSSTVRPTDSLSSPGSEPDTDRYGQQDELQFSSSPELDDAFSSLHNEPERERQSAFYDYKQEKALRQTDAKLFYQPQQGTSSAGWHSPVTRSSTWGGGVSRPESVKSMGSLQQSSHLTGSNTPTVSHHPGHPFSGQSRGVTGLASLEKPVTSSEVQVSSIGRFDPHGVLDAHANRPVAPAAQTQNNPRLPNSGYTETRGGYAHGMLKSREKLFDAHEP